jgi:hypothetical protein
MESQVELTEEEQELNDYLEEAYDWSEEKIRRKIDQEQQMIGLALSDRDTADANLRLKKINILKRVLQMLG